MTEDKEVTVSRAPPAAGAAGAGISQDVAVAAVLSELNSIFGFKEEQVTAPKGFLFSWLALGGV